MIDFLKLAWKRKWLAVPLLALAAVSVFMRIVGGVRK